MRAPLRREQVRQMSGPETPPTSRFGPWLRRIAIGLLALFAVVVVIRVVGVYRQRAAREAIANTGWWVEYRARPTGASSSFLQQLMSRVNPSGRFSGYLWSAEEEIFAVSIVELEGETIETDLSLLAQMSSLESLTLHREDLSAADIRLIASLTSLRELHLVSDTLDDEGLAQLETLTQLERLTIDSNRVTDIGLGALARMPDLRDLDVQATRVSGTGLRSLPQSSELQRVALGEFADDDGLAAVGEITRLQSLIVGSRAISDRGMQSLAGLHQLEELTIVRHPNITDAGLAAIAQLPALKVCAIHSHRMTFDGASRFADSPAIVDLELRGGSLNDDGLAQFTAPASLQMLRLYHTSVSDEALDAFEAAHPEIRLWR